jgi:hypothetical protein
MKEKPRRRWFQFSLRTMFVVMTVACVFLFVPVLFVALFGYLFLIAAVARSAWQNRGNGRWAGALLALLMLTIPAWTMSACWLFIKCGLNEPSP